jgi:uncharacterized protein (TIGR02246 family)
VPLSVDDRLEIQDLYAAYNYAIDEGRAEDFAACFTADGYLDVALGDPSQGTDALVAFAAGTHQMVPGLRHSVSNLRVTADGDEVVGQAYILAYRQGAAGFEVLMSGRYLDHLRRVDGAWRFARRVVTPDTPPAG